MKSLIFPSCSTPIACALAVLALPWEGHSATQNPFGPQQVITTSADGAWSVYATDLDGDGDADVLSASRFDDKIAWYENLGGGAFGAQQVITTSVFGAWSVYATDLDGDGDADVLSASAFDSKIAWHENLGGGVFGVQQVITTSAFGAHSVYATDLDGDGDADLLSASGADNKIAWYENLGGGAFGAKQVITTSADGAMAVYATDLDADGDADVLSASRDDNKIAWYENLGGGAFSAQQVITVAADGAVSVYATDLDGDGDVDVLSASEYDDKIAWYENLAEQGEVVFGAQQVITTSAVGAWSVYATDLDGDGDADVLSAALLADEIAWYENLGGGAFGAQQVITTSADATFSVYATDLDGDGDADVLSASAGDFKIAWYENLMGPFDCNGNLIPDAQDIAQGTSQDCNANLIPDECDLAAGASLDLDCNAVPDECQGTLSLTATPCDISITAGGVQSLSLEAGSAYAFNLYLLLGSSSGSSPGFPIGAELVPLNIPDPYFSYTLQSPNSPLLTPSLGALPPGGAATASFTLPAGVAPASLVGLSLHHAFVVLDNVPAVVFASNAAPVSFLP